MLTDKERKELAAIRMAALKKDFMTSVHEVGYVKARQFLKRSDVSKHLAKVKESDKKQMSSFRNDRMKELIRLSNTTGMPSSETAIDKILSKTNKRPYSRYEGQSLEDQEREFDNDIALSRCLINALLQIPQQGLENLPMGLGDTLFLQVAPMREAALPRNKLQHMMSFRTPQLQMIHLRYLITLNLSGNKLFTLPAGIKYLKQLKCLDISFNSVSKLPEQMSGLHSLEDLDASNNNLGILTPTFNQLTTLKTLKLNNNLFRCIPSEVTKLRALNLLDFSFNGLQHIAIIPAFLPQEAMWHEQGNPVDGTRVYVNVLTKEKVKNPKQYDGKGIRRAAPLHQNQPYGTMNYIRRKVWLSICKVNEFDAIEDIESGWIYYRNNVSGETQWDMPHELDTFSLLDQLEEFNCSNNMLKGLSTGICSCKLLERLNVSYNRMHSLPDQFGNLTSLQQLSIQHNELRILPTSLCDCISMNDLMCQGNQLLRLPDNLGTLPRLKRIDASSNRMASLPLTIGFSKSCTDLVVHDNPLEDPDQSEVAKGLEHLKWYLRQRMFLDEKGLPPAMEHNHISIRQEVTILYPDWRLRIKHMMKVASKDGTLNLQLMGIILFPREILKIGASLKALQLDFNPMLDMGVNGFQTELSGLKKLSLRACNQTVLSETISVLKRLNTLNLEENAYEVIPKGLLKLRTVHTLNYSRNRIYDIPNRIGGMTGLKVLNLESNNLEYLPSELFSLKKLTVLNVSKNRIIEVHTDIAKLRDLKSLNIERNNMLQIPASIGDLKLKELKIGHNRLCWLPHEMFLGALGKRMQFFSIPENNLMELPYSLYNINPTCLFEADYNPLISPPSYILSEGLPVVQNYLHIRAHRIEELDELLEYEEFEYVAEHATPISSEIIEGGTGFLTPKDLAEFDAAVDEYVNGEFFLCPSSGEEIVGKLSILRDQRENDLYLAILRTASTALGELMKNDSKRFGKAVIDNSRRAWGRAGEEHNCYVVSLHALLNPNPPNLYQKEGRPSVLSIIESMLPPMPFPFSVELLKDSLKLYHSPYGQVAETENYVFSKCDCISDTNGRPTRHDPCAKPAVVLIQSIYTEDDAERREEEEDEFSDKFDDVDETCRAFMNSPEGRIYLKRECKMRRKILKEEISLREEMSSVESIQLNKAHKGLDKVKKRKEQFEMGEQFEVHEISTDQEAANLISQANKKIARIEERLKLIGTQMEGYLAMKQIDDRTWRRMAADDLVNKYCFLLYEEDVKQYRKQAIAGGWPRPWDGEDGSTFDQWKNRLVGENLEESEEKVDIMKAGEDEKKDEEEESVEYDWEGTDRMGRFYCGLYERWKAKKDSGSSILGKFPGPATTSKFKMF